MADLIKQELIMLVENGIENQFIFRTRLERILTRAREIQEYVDKGELEVAIASIKEKFCSGFYGDGRTFGGKIDRNLLFKDDINKLMDILN